MATIIGGTSEIPVPAEVATLVDSAVSSALELITANFGAGSETALIQQASGNNFQQYQTNVDIASSDTVQTLVVVYSTENTVRIEIQLVTDSELQGMQGVTAHGNGVFSIAQSTFKGGNAVSALTVDGASLHALTDGSVEGAGVDSLTGGGAAINDAQANFLLTTAETSGASTSTLADIAHALKLISKAGTTAAADMAVDVVRLVLDENANYDQIDLNYGKNTLVMADLNDMGDTTLVLTGMQKALVTGAGTVRLGDSQEGSLLVGDSTNQVLISGTGSDTLVGGGGTDTLVGGAGADVFGFNTLGHYTITDFVAGVDKAYFEFGGIDSIDDIRAYLTGVTEVDGNTTFHFGPNASITLIGVSADAAIGPLLFDI